MVSIRNYGEERPVKVEYGQWYSVCSNSKEIANWDIVNNADSSIVTRVDLDSTTYKFTTSKGREYYLEPKSLGTQIIKIEFPLGDSTVVVDLSDSENLRKLKELGIVESKGFLQARTKIILNAN
jgi:hypothetical protein